MYKKFLVLIILTIAGCSDSEQASNQLIEVHLGSEQVSERVTKELESRKIEYIYINSRRIKVNSENAREVIELVTIEMRKLLSPGLYKCLIPDRNETAKKMLDSANIPYKTVVVYNPEVREDLECIVWEADNAMEVERVLRKESELDSEKRWGK